MPESASQGVSAPGDVCLGGVSAPGGVWSRGCLVWGGVCSRGVCSQGCLVRGVSAPGGWVGLLRGVYGLGEISVWSGGSASVPSGLPPPWEQNDKQVQKYYLGHNFVAAGNNPI